MQPSRAVPHGDVPGQESHGVRATGHGQALGMSSGGEPGSWLTACYELQSTTFSTGTWAAGPGVILLQTDHVEEPSHSHRLMGGRKRGFISGKEQSTHLPVPAAEAGVTWHSRNTCPTCRTAPAAPASWDHEHVVQSSGVVGTMEHTSEEPFVR